MQLDRGLVLLGLATPGPGVSEPNMRNDMDWFRLIATIPSSHSEEQRIRVIILFGRLDDYVPVLIVLKAACVEKLVFFVLLASLCVTSKLEFVAII